MKEKRSYFVTLENVGRALKALALLTFLVFFFIMIEDIWVKFCEKMTTFGIRNLPHFQPTKFLPSVTFCPLPGKDLFVTIVKYAQNHERVNLKTNTVQLHMYNKYSLCTIYMSTAKNLCMGVSFLKSS